MKCGACSCSNIWFCVKIHESWQPKTRMQVWPCLLSVVRLLTVYERHKSIYGVAAIPSTNSSNEIKLLKIKRRDFRNKSRLWVNRLLLDSKCQKKCSEHCVCAFVCYCTNRWKHTDSVSFFPKSLFVIRLSDWVMLCSTFRCLSIVSTQ